MKSTLYTAIAISTLLIGCADSKAPTEMDAKTLEGTWTNQQQIPDGFETFTSYLFKGENEVLLNAYPPLSKEGTYRVEPSEDPNAYLIQIEWSGDWQGADASEELYAQLEGDILFLNGEPYPHQQNTGN